MPTSATESAIFWKAIGRLKCVGVIRMKYGQSAKQNRDDASHFELLRKPKSTVTSMASRLLPKAPKVGDPRKVKEKGKASQLPDETPERVDRQRRFLNQRRRACEKVAHPAYS
jgi:hypothetical protein